jgi:hypothetical protein
MFSNSKDQVSLEEAYGSVKRNVINENLAEVGQMISTALANTQHLPAGIQGLITLASFAVPGAMGAAAVAGLQHLASRAGVQDIIGKVKALLQGRPVAQQQELLKDIGEKTSDQIAQNYINDPSRENLEAFLNDLKKSLDAAKNSHVDRSAQKMADHIDGKTAVAQESFNSTLRYLGGKGSKQFNPEEGLIKESRKGSTLDYLK